MKEKIQQLVISVTKNNTEDIEVGEVTQNTLLLSEGSAIDSMAIVSIIVDLESELSEVFSKDISLSDDRAMSRKISPYENVNNLVEYILELLQE